MNALTQAGPAYQAPAISGPLSLLMDVPKFEHMCRVGKMLALSPLFPQHLRGGSIEQGTANAVLVLNMANRLNEDPLSVAQNIYFVGGRPGWNTTYMIAKANQHGVFRDPIDWDIKGKGDTLSATAFGFLSGTGKRVQVTCDMEMAKKEGWTKNAKYQSIPEQMLRYRSAAFLIRLYCPEVMIGVPSAIEMELEARDVTPDGGPTTIKATADAPIEAKAEPVEDPAKAQKDANDAAEAKARDAAEAERKRKEQAEADRQRKAEKQAEAESKAAASEQTAQTDAPAPDRERFENLYEMIAAEAQNGASAQEIEETYGPFIEQMKAHFPDLAERLAGVMKAE